MGLTHYETLGLSSDCSIQSIKKAYKEKLLNVHPDKSSDASSRSLTTITVNSIQDAYRILSNPDSRLIYDEQLKNENKQQGFHGSGDGLDEYSLDEFYFNPAVLEYCMDCPRCQAKEGFHFSEDKLEEHAQERQNGGFQVLAQCSACSLWLKVDFDVAEEYEQENS